MTDDKQRSVEIVFGFALAGEYWKKYGDEFTNLAGIVARSTELGVAEIARVAGKICESRHPLREVEKKVGRGKMREILAALESAEEQHRFNDLMERPVEKLELSVRGSECLQKANIRCIGELVELTEQDLLELRNFGPMHLGELKERLDWEVSNADIAGVTLGIGKDPRLVAWRVSQG